MTRQGLAGNAWQLSQLGVDVEAKRRGIQIYLCHGKSKKGFPW